MAIGRVGSFATDSPLQQNYVGQALTDTENQGFKYRAERRLIADAKKKEEEEEEEKIAKEFDEFDKSLVPTITGYSSIDDPVNMYAMDVKQKGVDWIRQKNQERDPYKKAEIQSKINKATQSFKMLNQYPKFLNEKKAEIEKGVMDGKYNERDLDSVNELAKSLDSGKYDMRVDENGVPRMTIYKVDENGVPVGVLEKNISLGDLTNRITPFNKPTYDIKGGISEQITAQIKLDESKIQSGFTTITKEQRNKRVDDALKIKAKEVASMPSEAYELWQKMGNPPKRTFSDADKQQISEYVFNDLKSRYREKYEKDIDQSGLTSRMKYNDDKKKEEVIISEPSTIKSPGEKDGVKLQQNAKDFPLGNVIIKGVGGKEQKATNVYVNPGGKIFLRVEESGFESSNKKQTRYTKSGQAKIDQFKRENEALVAQGKPEKPITELQLDFGDIEDITTSNKSSKPKMLDFGKDANEIGRYALRMGYESAKDMQDDFIRRSGGDEFINTPDERKKPKTKKQGSYDDL
jgi:hypothetical protein